MTQQEPDFEGCMIELKSFIGTLRYLVAKAGDDEAAGDLFFCLANAADAIYDKFEACNGGAD